MGISSTKRKFLIGQTLFALISGTIVGLLIRYLFPSHYFLWYPSIPLFFYLFGWFYIYMFEECRKRTPDKIHMVYMSMKVAKMLLSMFILLFYVMFDKDHKVDFVLTFLLFYVLSLIYETCFFYSFEKHLKLKKENKK